MESIECLFFIAKRPFGVESSLILTGRRKVLVNAKGRAGALDPSSPYKDLILLGNLLRSGNEEVGINPFL